MDGWMDGWMDGQTLDHHSFETKAEQSWKAKSIDMRPIYPFPLPTTLMLTSKMSLLET